MKSLVRIVAIVALSAGCEGVPDLAFVDAEAASDASEPSDASADGASDAGAGGDASSDAGSDASDAAATSDAPPMCPVAPPQGATTCCGTNNAYPCVGNCGTTQCAACVSTCGTAQLCCGKNNGMVMCIAPNGHCP